MEPVNLVVARARIAGGVMLEREAPAELRVTSGSEVLVKFPFRFDEVSADREDYTVILRTRLDGEALQEEMFEGRDHPARDDGRRGFLVHRHRVMASGTHTLEFQAVVRLARSAWKGDDADLNEAEVEGQVRLVTS